MQFTDQMGVGPSKGENVIFLAFNIGPKVWSAPHESGGNNVGSKNMEMCM